MPKPKWTKEEAFPVIEQVVKNLCQQNGSADRDQIASALINDPSGKRLIQRGLQGSDRSAFRVAGNIVDWFSAELTSHSSVAARYTDIYKRERVKRSHLETGKSREIYLYTLAL
ncbi:MAG: hypothetical protein NW220_15845 [Leptolyngbyaceae cyanobacterium bins.349]|nr:hypothetical protein [Leptolyngbyaceae cyanobacterium bins.349]